MMIKRLEQYVKINKGAINETAVTLIDILRIK